MAGRVKRKPQIAAPPDPRAQLQETELLLRIAKQVAVIETLNELLHTIVEITSAETNADRGTLFLNDETTGELYSRVLQGALVREIRILNTSGTAGRVFTTGKGMIVNRTYQNPYFDRSVDKRTGYRTKNILAAPIRSAKGTVIGVLEMVNKKRGQFTEEDLRRLEAMGEQTAITLQSTQFMERVKADHDREMQLLDVVSQVTAEFDLDVMLHKVISETAKMLDADRATIFLHDDKTNELFSRVAMGNSIGEIRIPDDSGIAGAVYKTSKTINIPHAYADLRFNPQLDKKTGYFTRSVLSVPVADHGGKTVGVMQVLNKKGGGFTAQDEARLKAFTAQVAISLQNAQLFEDAQNMKNYNESMLESMSNGVITLDEDGRIVKCNLAASIIFRLGREEILQQTAHSFFMGQNAWILDRIATVGTSLLPDYSIDAQLNVNRETISVNLTVLPLMTEARAGDVHGTLLIIEDISAEKRMKSTMARYMDPMLADQMLARGAEALGGKSALATVLFSDIRGFTELAEELGPHQTVTLLNEYFTIMVDCIQREGGMLDKFIGDAIMAAFGLPTPHQDDEDRAVRAAISMITELRRWNTERVAAGTRPLDIGIGVNTDTVISGNIGAPKRMDYTIIGDGVNLASRLESACKQYCARILISESTRNKLRGTYRVREVDRVVVKGRKSAVAVYEVLDYHTEESFPHILEALQYFSGGVAYYREAQWDKAIAAFKEAVALNPQDRLPGLYIERCEFLRANPPGNGWDGIWRLTTK
jgi:adenylate cyclase